MQCWNFVVKTDTIVSPAACTRASLISRVRACLNKRATAVQQLVHANQIAPSSNANDSALLCPILPSALLAHEVR